MRLIDFERRDWGMVKWFLLALQMGLPVQCIRLGFGFVVHFVVSFSWLYYADLLLTNAVAVIMVSHSYCLHMVMQQSAVFWFTWAQCNFYIVSSWLNFVSDRCVLFFTHVLIKSVALMRYFSMYISVSSHRNRVPCCWYSYESCSCSWLVSS